MTYRVPSNMRQGSVRDLSGIILQFQSSWAVVAEVMRCYEQGSCRHRYSYFETRYLQHYLLSPLIFQVETAAGEIPNPSAPFRSFHVFVVSSQS